MDLGIKDKVALVLASSKGLGKAVAMELAKEGAKVIICGTDAAALSETEKELKSLTSNDVHSIICDLTDEGQRKILVAESLKRFDKIDILVTNSGGPTSGSFGDFDLDDWRSFYNLLFLSVADIIKQVLPGMKERHSGRILAITSITVKQPADNLISSNAVRTSLVGLIKSLSNEVGSFGITVNCLLPGYTTTNRLKHLIEKNPKVSEITATIPMKRFGTPEEFAAAAAFLVSERASYITGQSLAVDGGWIKGY